MRKFPSYLRHSLATLIIFLMGISIARLLVTMRQQAERIEILEGTVAQILADTSRLSIPAAPRHYSGSNGYNGYYNQADRHTSYPKQRRSASAIKPSADESLPLAAAVTSADSSANGQPVAQAAPVASTSHKFTSPHIFDLNTVDSLTLIRIPGIAGRTASVILQQRQRYGGFYNANQLRDFLTWDAALCYIDEWCSDWFTADASRLRAIPINTASISEMQRHPYLSHEQAVEIVRYRTRHKHISSATELQQFSSFTSEQLNNLLPYLSFE